jgi:D-3-phosphoglycerate dehydrogenase
MNILIADKIDENAILELKKIGQISFRDENFLENLKKAEILIVRSATKVDKNLLDNASSLKMIIRAGVGLDNIDLKECEKKGIKVYNTPNSSTNAVAELAIGLMLCLIRKICFLNNQLSYFKKWEKEKGIGYELKGKTLGIIGMGRIGQEVAKKAKYLGMNIQYYDKTNKNLEEFKYVQNLDDLLATSDIITIHASVSKEDGAIIDEERIKKIKEGAFLINLSRGFAINEQALIKALKSKKIQAAALDVFEKEPYNGELCGLENVILTPHIGASTYEAQNNIGLEIIEIIKSRFKP